MKSTEKTILVIEDDKALNQAIVLKLKRKGYVPVSVFTAEDALNILEVGDVHIDFIWLDILLPGMNGLEFLRSIKENHKFKNIKVAVISASGGYEQQEVAKKLGAIDYIVKSNSSLEEIAQKVSEDLAAN